MKNRVQAFAFHKFSLCRYAEVRVDACSCPSRVGVTGIVVRDTARTLQLICARNNADAADASDALVDMPKRGALFSLEVPFQAGSVKEGAGNGSRRRRFVLRGGDLAR